MLVLHLFVLLIIKALLTQVECRTPIVIVPGIGGSQIEAKLDKNASAHYWCYRKYQYWFTLWLNIEELLPWAQECWVDNLKLKYDTHTKKMNNTPGVYTRNPDFGNTSSIEWLDPSSHVAGIYFFPLIDSLCRILKYERGRDLRAAPYDFRFDPGSAGNYFDHLKKLIEETYELNGKKKIMLLSHSMGAPYSLRFLRSQTQEWKDTYLSAWTTISGVFAGSVKAILAYVSGDGFGIPSILDKPRYLREFQRTFSSLAFILPDKDFWSSEEPLVKTENRTYTVTDYDALFEDMGYPLGKKVLKSVPRAWHEEAPNIKMFCFHGNHVPTAGVLKYPPGYFPDYRPDIDFADGDGTVDERSLEACRRWKGLQKQPITYRVFSGAEHNGILGDARVFRSIVSALQESETGDFFT